MKRKGACADYKTCREDEIVKAYRQRALEAETVVVRDIFEVVANSPAPRFYVSERRAAIVVSDILRGRDVVGHMGACKREMYQEICRRVTELLPRRGRRKLLETVSEVVNGPAPKFYMTAGSARVIYYRARDRWFERQKAEARRQATLARMWRELRKG